MYLGKFLTDLHQIWFAALYWSYECKWDRTSIGWKFKLAPSAILDFDFRHISVANEDICVKFGRRVNIGHGVLWVKIQLSVKFKMAAAASWKYTNRYISANSWPICTKFRLQTHILPIRGFPGRWKFKMAVDVLVIRPSLLPTTITLLVKFKTAAAAILDLGLWPCFGRRWRYFRQIWCEHGQNTLIIKFKIVAICTKSGTPIQNEIGLPMTIRKYKSKSEVEFHYAGYGTTFQRTYFS